VLVTTTTDSSLSSGAPGVALWGNDASFNAYVDDWEGGDLYNELTDVDLRFLRRQPVYRR